MFERYTESARRALFYSRYEASEFGSLSIEPEHLFLGLLHGGDILKPLLAVPPDTLRAEIEAGMAKREKIATSVEIPFTEAAKRALEFAAKEADALGHSYIGTEHLLLGLLREEASVPASVLAARGIRLEDVRGAVAAMAKPDDAMPWSLLALAVQDIKDMVVRLARLPSDSGERRELEERILASLDRLLTSYGLR
jgi:ATP-dependent Clp protease ATP-binding subunit ClpC